MKGLNIIVCLKSIPDPKHPTESWVDAGTGVVKRKADEDGIPRVFSPLDRYALEEGLLIKEAWGGQVTVISMDTPAAEIVLKEALALGADKAVLLCDRIFAGGDTFATAQALSAAIRLRPFDLIFCGSWSYHGNTGQVGPQLAELLGVPHISFAREIELVDPSCVQVKTSWEDTYTLVEAGLPLLITVNETNHQPRRVSLAGIMRSRSKEVARLTASDIRVSPSSVGLAGSATTVTGVKMIGTKRQGRLLQGEPREMAQELVRCLREKRII